jgi:nitroimidazol reductase NimA-like FMN-containing flavoprotein (pyridoxamine 5'-phosphate oxidase superfamily)
MTASGGESWRGKTGKMNQAEIDDFLGRVALCRLACHDDDGWPYVVPTCFQYWDGGFYLVPRARSAWAHFMQKDPRVSLVIDDPVSQQRVSVKGEARVVEEPNLGGAWEAVADDMVRRYLGGIAGDYLASASAEPRWLFFVTPRAMTTWQGVDWAKKYKHAPPAGGD